MKYQISGPRGERLKTIDTGHDVSAEIGLLRLIAEEAGQVPASPLTVTCAAVIGRLCEADQAMKIRDRGYISTPQFHALMRWVSALLCELADDFLPEDRSLELLERFHARCTRESHTSGLRVYYRNSQTRHAKRSRTLETCKACNRPIEIVYESTGLCENCNANNWDKWHIRGGLSYSHRQPAHRRGKKRQR